MYAYNAFLLFSFHLSLLTNFYFVIFIIAVFLTFTVDTTNRTSFPHCSTKSVKSFATFPTLLRIHNPTSSYEMPKAERKQKNE